MYCTRKILDDLIWVGADDRRLVCFEGVYGVPDGVSYNSYLLLDEKTVLFDTVDKAVYGVFLENVAHALGGRPLDYLVVHHMEPDHAATLELLLQRHPETTVVCNAKIKTMIAQFFPTDLGDRFLLVKEGDTLSTGRHTLSFVMAPMVHWPEVMPPTPSAPSARSTAASSPTRPTSSPRTWMRPAATTPTSWASTGRRCRPC